MPRLQYFEPSSLAEALSFLTDHRGATTVMAGATDLMMDIRQNGQAAGWLVSLNGLTDFADVREEGGDLALGALTKIRDLETSALLRSRYPAIVEAASQFGSIQIRNLATLGGNLAHATPSAEMAPPLLVYEASVELAGPDGYRTVPLSNFFTGPRSTVIAPDEILTKVSAPIPPKGSGFSYLRLCARESLDIAIANVAAGLLVENGRVSQARIALGAVAPIPMRATAAENFLGGKSPDDAVLAEAAALAADQADPITDVRASAGYRREMVKVLTSRALQLAAHRAQPRRRG